MGLLNKKELCKQAKQRLTPEELALERKDGVPYAFSLNALADIWIELYQREGWKHSKNPVVLAVSGGSDSMALMWLFRVFFDGVIVVAHLEHGIRGNSSKEDAHFVQNHARNWGMLFELRQCNVLVMAQKSESIEMAARRIRYAFLEEVALKHNALGVALGHNREDVAETVLFNLLRGTGVRGAAGIPERRGLFFRPLISLSKQFLRGILKHRGLDWREDGTNLDSSYTRNFIRNELMPLIRERINTRADEHLVAFAEEMSYYRLIEEQRGDELFLLSGYEECEEARSLERNRVRNFSVWDKMLLLRAIGRRLGWVTLSRERTKELAHLISEVERFEFQWGGGAFVYGEQERIRLHSKQSGGK